MLINDIVKQINTLVSNSSSFQLTYEKLKYYINMSVDFINFELKTNMLNPEEEWESKEWLYTIGHDPGFLGSFYGKPKVDLNTKGKLCYDLTDQHYHYFNGLFWCPVDIVNGTYFTNDIVEHSNYLGAFNAEPEITDDVFPKYYYNTETNCYYTIASSTESWELVKYVSQKEFPLNITQISIEYANMNYSAMPDNVIRSVLIYHTAASYLEEEDEFEYQHSTYKQKAIDSLEKIKQIHYSVYTCTW